MIVHSCSLNKPDLSISATEWFGLRRTSPSTLTLVHPSHILNFPIPYAPNSKSVPFFIGKHQGYLQIRSAKQPTSSCGKGIFLSNSPLISPFKFLNSQSPSFPQLQNNLDQRNMRAFAGRSKKKPGGPSPGRIEGNAEMRREAKKNARKRSRRLAENLFYKHKNRSKNNADDFTEQELEMIGLGYDRMVRFMEQDDPNLRHPYDWYKYGKFGPYSWRGVVIGQPIRGRFSDERVSMIGTVKNHEEWEKIEQFEMASDFSRRLSSLDKNIGFKYFWVFVRHPKWKPTEQPWKQWTLVSEVVLESGEKRLDKWNLMGRLGNKSRALITQCAAWMRPDIIYVKRPVFQCRFEPQDDFFRVLGPLLDPESENNYLFELKLDDGRVEMCTYFGGLCKIVRANPKAFVDDVVKAYEKLDEDRKSLCLEFLLSNHPVPLLHPFTREWKAKLEEMEMGCDAPDDSSDDEAENQNEMVTTDWIEDDGDDDGEDDEDRVIDGDDDGDDEDDDGEDDEDRVIDGYDKDDDGEDDEDRIIDADKRGDDELGMEEETDAEESEMNWEEEFQNAVRSTEGMEKLVKRSLEVSTEFYKRQIEAMNNQEKRRSEEVEDLMEDSNVKNQLKQIRDEWNRAGFSSRRKIKRGRIPPELFLRAAVRPFTYRNLVKEIVLMRHAIIEKEIRGVV